MDGAFNLRPRKRHPSINITSLIDVMFLLLIFFMVSSTFRQQIGIDIQLPTAESGAEQEVEQHEILVDKEGLYYFDEQSVDEMALRARLEQAVQTDPQTPVVLRADKEADFGKVVRVIDLARTVGARQLIIPTIPAPE